MESPKFRGTLREKACARSSYHNTVRRYTMLRAISTLSCRSSERVRTHGDAGHRSAAAEHCG
jgi:hypothetical protein